MSIHATMVQWRGTGVLLCGPSGSGKSDLALRLIADSGVLVADDRVVVQADGGRLFASPPGPLAGLIEARGIGVLRVPYLALSSLDLAVDLHTAPPERLPPPRQWIYAGIAVPLIALCAFEASATAKLALVVQALAENRFPDDLITV